MEGGSGRWSGYTSWEDTTDSSGGQNIKGYEVYHDEKGTLTIIQTTHEGGKTTQTVTTITKEGEVTEETSTDTEGGESAEGGSTEGGDGGTASSPESTPTPEGDDSCWSQDCPEFERAAEAFVGERGPLPPTPSEIINPGGGGEERGTTTARAVELKGGDLEKTSKGDVDPRPEGDTGDAEDFSPVGPSPTSGPGMQAPGQPEPIDPDPEVGGEPYGEGPGGPPPGGGGGPGQQ